MAQGHLRTLRSHQDPQVTSRPSGHLRTLRSPHDLQVTSEPSGHLTTFRSPQEPKVARGRDSVKISTDLSALIMKTKRDCPE